MLHHIATGLIVSILMLIQFSEGYLSFRTLGIASVGLLVALVATNSTLARSSATQTRPRLTSTAILILCVFAFHVIHDLVSRALDSGIKQAIILSMGEIFIVLGIVYFAFLHRTSDNLEKWFGLTIAIGSYSAANLFAYKLGIKSVAGSEENIAAIGNLTAERMLAPFSSGVNSFGSICSLGLCIALFTGHAAYRQKRSAMLLLCLLVIAVNLICVFLVQIRSALFAFLFAVVLLFLQERKRGTNANKSVSAILTWVSALALVALPVSFYELAAVSIVDAIVPAKAYELIGRHSLDFSYLGGRALIWDSGWALLQQGNVGLLGQGIEARDSSLVLGDFLGSEMATRTSYHNGFMEFLIVYGLFASIIFIGMLGNTVASIKRTINASLSEVELRSNQFRLGILAACITISFLEAFSVSPFFWGTIICVVLIAPATIQSTVGRRFSNQ
jgi:hypothetical protein